MSTRPSDDAIVIALLSTGRQWLYAAELRGVLARFGWQLQTQAVAAWLGRLSREDSPMVERRQLWESDFEYRVTCFGRTQAANRFPGLRFFARGER